MDSAHPGGYGGPNPALQSSSGGNEMAQFQGSVRWFNNAKGYGFLGREGGADVFVHYTAIQSPGYKSLKEGELVSYDVVQGDKGPQADQVIRLKPSH
jgi:cold shock protein